MSENARHTPLPQTVDLVFADVTEPFTPKPLLTDLLRTRYCVPGSIFLVEGYEVLPLPKSKRWRTVRLFLGDGEFCIQALLHADMHGFLDAGSLRVGCYIRLEKFFMNSRVIEKETGKAQMVYLVVESFDIVGWNMSVGTARELEDVKLMDPVSEWGEDIGLVDFDGQRDGAKLTTDVGAADEADSDDDFERMTVSEEKASQRRMRNAQDNDRGTKHQATPVALPKDWKDKNTPLKLTPLRSVPNLPYKQNWSINILAIVVSLSDVEPCHIAPYTQRTARLTDPSTSKQVLLTVFLDPEEFRPTIGSAVLLAGVKNHRFEGGCLKKYASDRPRPGNRWWFEDPFELAWCNVAGLHKWWAGQKLNSKDPNAAASC